MKILSLDTSTEYMSLGLKIDEDFYSINIKAGQTHSEIALPEIKKLLSYQGWTDALRNCLARNKKIIKRASINHNGS